MIPKSMTNEYCSILLPGISTVEIQILEVTDEQIRGKYDDNEEIFIRQSAIACYWPDRGRREAKERAKERALKMKDTKKRENTLKPSVVKQKISETV